MNDPSSTPNHEHHPTEVDITDTFKPELRIFKAEMSVNIQTSPHPDWSDSNTSLSQALRSFENKKPSLVVISSGD